MDSKQRFSDRVDRYVKYRPSYPKEALDVLYERVGFREDSVIADIGAGTGIFSRLLLERGSTVIAVEPNASMRQEAEIGLSGYERFRTVEGSAEQSGLADASVDGVVCAQAFHWFDQERAKQEFRRILKPGGKAALIWNSRRTEGTLFLELYEQLLETYGTDYKQVRHTNIEEDDFKSFFKPETLQYAECGNDQLVDFDGLAGRLLSSSYSPLPGHPSYEPMMAELRMIFDRTQTNGQVAIEYKTQVFWGEV